MTTQSELLGRIDKFEVAPRCCHDYLSMFSRSTLKAWMDREAVPYPEHGSLARLVELVVEAKRAMAALERMDRSEG